MTWTSKVTGTAERRTSALSAGGSPAHGEHSRVQATSDLPQFLKHASHPGQRAFRPLGQFAGSRRDRCLRLCQLQAESDQPLLGAVMQIALDPATGGIADGHNPRPGSGQLGLCLCV